MPKVGGPLSLVALVVVVSAAALWGGVAGASPRAASGTEALTLRLSDLGPGYLVGDDSGCGLSFAGEGAPRVLAGLGRRYRHRGCVIQFERLWAPPGEPPAPALVESAAIEFRGEAGAVAGLEVARAAIAYTTGVPRDSLERRPLTVTLGDSIAVFHTDDALVEGRGGRPGVAVVWRTGRVEPQGRSGRSRSPSSSRAGSRRRPRSRQRTTTARCRSTTRGSVSRSIGSALGSGPRAACRRWCSRIPSVRSAATTGPAGAPRSTTARVIAAAASSSGCGRLVRTQRCARATRRDLPTGRAVIYAGHANPPKRCGRRPPNLYLAHVFLDDVVLTINVPVCFLCVELLRGLPDAYNTLPGLMTVIEALEPRA